MQSLQVTELGPFAAAEAPLLLDVREPWEVAIARLDLPPATTLAMPMREVPARLAEIDRRRPVVCICHHGVRSAQVVAFLQRQGHERVYNLAGGIDAWSTRVDPRTPRY
ncbi:rhodanese-like domain-containing protein [Azohydromonas sp.]|uniref:rhodanese-like domain-containing protein n=1 Tax=Azohydromonas sp. TaxID=1872666 RepID=UPI002B898D16|nr:rhodanese-like domain-containing protein [Azohydromonas sp.]HMM86214.1 rhodanese-like domain-containing protein [Azohydromonas sp.]